MNIFVVWSGGLDSTYCIQHLLESGHTVTAGYVRVLNNESKTKRGLSAIDSILNTELWRDYRFSYVGEIGEGRVSVGNDELMLMLPLLFLSSAAQYAGGRYDAVALGYVIRDDACSFFEDFKLIYKSFQGLFSEPIGDLIFPVSKLSKQMIMNKLNKRLVPLVTWCESKYEEDNCGNCVPCVRADRDGLADHAYRGDSRVSLKALSKTTENKSIEVEVEEPVKTLVTTRKKKK